MNKFEDIAPVKRAEIINLCKEKGKTIPQIAKEIGCSPTTIYKYLNKGEMPRMMLKAIAGAIFPHKEPPTDEKDSVFPMYTNDLIKAKFYLTRALNKMDEIYLRKGGCE